MCHNRSMKVTIIVATTVDGFIGRTPGHLSTTWTSPEDKLWFKEFTKQAGVMVMGSRTFATFGRGLPGRKIFVYTRKPEQFAAISGVETIRVDPGAFIKRLEEEGHEHLAVCGGSTIYRLFMAAGVVDDIYVTLEPLLFGTGIPLFDQEVGTKLTLIDSRPLNESSLLLHYAVQK